MNLFSICIYDNSGNFNLENLPDGVEIIYSNIADKKNVISLNKKNINEANFRNECLKKASGRYLFWLNNETEFEEELLEEYENTIDKTDADIIYSNEILIDKGQESIKKYRDWHENEKDLLGALDLEEYLPKWGIATKKEKIDKFEEKYGEESFYAFVYKNLPNLSLKLSEESFIPIHKQKKEKDLTYKSLLLRDILNEYDLKNIFQNLNWEKENVALATAYTIIGDKLYSFNDYYNASNFFRQALISFHNQETLKRLIDTYYQMGLFDEAKKMIETQDLVEKLKKDYLYKIEKTKEMIKELEKQVQLNNLDNLLEAQKDIFSTYQGAPIQNIYGVIMFKKGKIEESFRYFYKAVTMNPLDNDIISNIVELAKVLNKKEKVVKLIERLTK